MHQRWLFAVNAVLMAGAPAGAQPALKDVKVDVKVAAPTRLDWAFAAQGFGKDAGKLPANYDSTKQRYQLFVPKTYSKDKSWPLVLFISAGDQPAGWTGWKKTCESEGVLFASPYAAGNNVPGGQRTRIILDVLDDVRHNYRIDPQQTYVSGFSGGGRMACAIGFALPEYFGGIAPVCGTNPVPGPAWLRHRAMDRLAVALITGDSDFNRKENEAYMAPWLEEVQITTKLWVVPKMGHAIPSPDVMYDVYAWLKKDLPRRQAEATARPKLAVTPNDGLSGAEQGMRMLEAAVADLRDVKRIWRGVALLQGVTQRWGKTEAGQKAAVLLKVIANDERLLGEIGAQGAEDEQKSVAAQAKAFERFGQTAQAIQAWEILARNYEGTPPGKQAQEQVRRLQGMK